MNTFQSIKSVWNHSMSFRFLLWTTDWAFDKLSNLSLTLALTTNCYPITCRSLEDSSRNHITVSNIFHLDDALWLNQGCCSTNCDDKEEKGNCLTYWNKDCGENGGGKGRRKKNVIYYIINNLRRSFYELVVERCWVGNAELLAL